MIPSVINYCWFGGNEKNELITHCMESWRKFCPDFEIIEWTEENYSTDNTYFNQAIKVKKWAFAADYARLDIIYHYGGIYLDTDVELLKPLDEMLKGECYLGVEEGKDGLLINTGVGFGATPKHPVIKKMLEEYNNSSFIIKENEFDLTPCPIRNTRPMIEMGYSQKREIQVIDNSIIYPPEFFAPKNYLTREVHVTKHTISIHHYDGAWMEKRSKIRLRLKEILGPQIMKKLYRLRGIDIE